MLVRHLRLSHKERAETSSLVVNDASSSAHEDAKSSNSPHPLNFEGTEDFPPVADDDYSLLSTCALVRNTQDNYNDTTGTPTAVGSLGLVAGMAADQNYSWNENNHLELWNHSRPFLEVLPASFFDTTLSLVDVSQQYSQNFHVENPTSCHSAKFSTQHIDHLSSEGLAYRSPNFTEQSSTQPSDPSRQAAGNEGELCTTTENERDPSQNHRLERNFNSTVCPWRISPADYEVVLTETKKYVTVLPQFFSMPSRYTLSRFLEGFFRKSMNICHFCMHLRIPLHHLV